MSIVSQLIAKVEAAAAISCQGKKELKTTLCLVLICATLGVYWQVSMHDFVNYDDPLFVYENPHVYTGISVANFKWAFSTLHGDASYYHPLTWLSHQLDCQLFGLRPGAHHLTNVFLHISNAVMLFLLLVKMTEAMWRSFIVAMLFALHPLHVETVAWISERKGLLCAFFWLLTLFAYARYARRTTLANYLLVILCCAASLMSKPFAVTLPFVLFLLDFWPLGRAEQSTTWFAKGSSIATRFCRGKQLVRCLELLLEKLPLFAMAAVSGWLTIIAQRELGALSSLDGLPMDIRASNATVSLIEYIRSTIWPAGLAPIYVIKTGLRWWQTLGCGVSLAGLWLLVLRLGKHRPYLTTGWHWYVGTLVPVLGLLQAGLQGMADRYTYIPLIGLFVAVVWACAELLGNKSLSRAPIAAISACILVAYAVAATVQVSYWKSKTRLFEHAIEVSNENGVAHRLMGLAFFGQTNFVEAELQLREAVRINPMDEMNHAWLGAVYFEEGDLESALREYLSALNAKPDSVEAHARLADLYAKSPYPRFIDRAKAVKHAERACQLVRYHRRDLLVLLAHVCEDISYFPEGADAARRALALSVSPNQVQEANQLLASILEKQSKNQ